MSVEKYSPLNEPARATISCRSAELAHRLGQAGAVELADVAGVALGERVGARLRAGEHRVDGGDGIARIALQQRIEVPADLLDLVVCDVRGALMSEERLSSRACRQA